MFSKAWVTSCCHLWPPTSHNGCVHTLCPHLHIRAGPWSPDELLGQVQLNGALRQELHPLIMSQRPSMSCLCPCPPSLHPKTNPGLCREMQSFTLMWCWQRPSYHKGRLNLHQDIRRQVCYNSALVIEEKEAAELHKSY